MNTCRGRLSEEARAKPSDDSQSMHEEELETWEGSLETGKQNRNTPKGHLHRVGVIV